MVVSSKALSSACKDGLLGVSLPRLMSWSSAG